MEGERKRSGFLNPKSETLKKLPCQNNLCLFESIVFLEFFVLSFSFHNLTKNYKNTINKQENTENNTNNEIILKKFLRLFSFFNIDIFLFSKILKKKQQMKINKKRFKLRKI